MCAYNRLNGSYCSENKTLTKDILRDRWGFQGLVVTDWGAVNDRPQGVAAGLDLEMPGSGGINDRATAAAVRAVFWKRPTSTPRAQCDLAYSGKHA